MVKLKSLIYESKTLIPRRSRPERERRWIQEIYRQIQDYIKDGSKGGLDLSKTPIKILPDNLKIVNGHLWLYDSKIEDLNNLKRVGGTLELKYTPLSKKKQQKQKFEQKFMLKGAFIYD